MAAHGNSFIRVRLYFDYPPPAVVDCRMCWLLVDLNRCRVVADLESIIREKFEFSRRSILNLFIEDCYLPHTESIYVVRDNDSVRVKVDYLVQINGNSSHPDAASEQCKKRQRPMEEDGPGENVEWKKKRKKGSEDTLERDAKQPSGDLRSDKSQEKHTKKKKKKRAEESSPAVNPKPAAATKKTPVRLEQPVKGSKKPPAAQAKTQKAFSSDSGSSSSSEEDEAPPKKAVQKLAPKTPSSTPAAPKAPPTTKPTQTKQPSSSSSSSETSSDEATSGNPPPKNKPLTSTTPKGRASDNSVSHPAPPALQSTNCAQNQAASTAAPPHDQTMKPCSSSSEEEIKFVIRQSAQQPGHNVGGQASLRGRGRGRPRRGGPGERGRGEGRGGFMGNNGSFELSYNGAKEPSYHTDSLTITALVLQNGAESAPKQDYSSMPLLAAPPQVGQKIAFKLLELTANYTPEVSEYKEGVIVSFDSTTKQIELELHNASQAPVEPGKFDLVYQNPDGSERVEYAVTRSSRVTERWDSLLEPRLII